MTAMLTGPSRHDVLGVLVNRYRNADTLRRGSGGTEDDPYTGDPWFRAQIVAFRDVARDFGWDLDSEANRA